MSGRSRAPLDPRCSSPLSEWLCHWRSARGHGCCQQAVTQSTCRLWHRPAEQMLNSEACYSFWKQNKLHQHLPRSLPSRLKSAVFSVRDSCVPASGNGAELCREWSGANVSTAQCFARLPNRVPRKGLAGRQTFREFWAACGGEGNGEVQPEPRAPQEIGEIDVFWAASIGWVPWPKILLTFLLRIHLWWLMLVTNLTESKITLAHCSNVWHHSTD